MLTRWYRTATRYLTISLCAVFFSTPSHSADSSLYKFEDGLNDLIYDLSRSVVTVEASSPLPWEVVSGTGETAIFDLVSTGLVYDSLGHILAAASTVIGRTQIIVRYEDRVATAIVAAIDYQRDLALLKVVNPLGHPVTLSQQYGCAGQMLIAMGGAYGLRASPSLGFCAGVRPDGLIQFTAPITSGTVGGGLFSLSGQLIGLITGSMGQGNLSDMGLAVPAQEVSAIAQYLLAHGDRTAGFVGVSSADIEITPGIEIIPPNQLAGGIQRREIIERGVVITNVLPSSPAGRAGLRNGDLIFSINGRRIASALDLAAIVRRSAPGIIVEIGLIRRNSALHLPLKVGQKKLLPYQPTTLDDIGFPENRTFRDSLMLEINTLKQTIRHLEGRLKQLR